jgi:hypothetical protein
VLRRRPNISCLSPAGREPERAAPMIVAPLAANCSASHFSPSLRFLRYLGVKYLQPVAANYSSCSHLQHTPPPSFPSLSPRPAGREPERAAPMIVAPLAANCSASHFSPSLRYLRYLGVKYLQPVAANYTSCSHLQHTPPPAFPSLSPRPAGREPERGAPMIVAQLAANCSASRFSPSLRFLRYLGVKYLQPVAAHAPACFPIPLAPPGGERAGERGANDHCTTCSKLQRLALQPFSSFPPLPCCEILAATCSKLQQLQPFAAHAPACFPVPLAPPGGERAGERGANDRCTTCSKLQRLALQPFSSFPSLPWCEILAASCSKLQQLQPFAAQAPACPSERPQHFLKRIKFTLQN